MSFLGFGRKEKEILDLSEKYRKQQEQAQTANKVPAPENPNPEINSSETENLAESSESPEDELTKRFRELTEKLDKVSSQIYRLQQRVELLEKKMNVGQY